ncbi:MAG: DUF4268 domain-containing protein [Desulfovibrio sp.]|nr:DUF4268 domain-containing protein [Desulfovibrio sp.]
MTKLGRLEEIQDLRGVWADEARYLTPWLAQDENIAILSDAIGIDITVDETESPVGDFSADILATETVTGRKIIIENQLESTDHEHLGKLITYASGKSADVVIWIVKRAREEHRSAIEWLNSHTDDTVGFFLCEIKLFRIGESDPAVKFEVIEKPNDWTKEIKKSGNTSETKQQRYDYWAAFNEYAFRDSRFSKNFNRRKPSFDHWMDFSMGSSAYHLSVRQLRESNELAVDFYIQEDKNLFNFLFSRKDQIESDSGLEFAWKELPGRKSSRIVMSRGNVIFSDSKQCNSQFEWIAQTMLKMKDVFKKNVALYQAEEWPDSLSNISKH